MRTDLVRNGFGAAGIARRGRKVRTSDCRKCFLLQSFRNAGLPATTIHALCEQMWLNRVHRRQILYVDGNRATHLYAIRSGKVKLVRPVASGREHVTAVLETGDLFGFEAIFDSAYATGAVALTDCELCLASGAELSDVMSEVPRLATDLARYLHHQLCRTRERQACLGASGASAKLASFFLHGLSSYGGNSGRDFTVAGGIIEILPSVYRCGTCSPSSGWLHTEVLTSVKAAHGARSMREHHAPLILPGLSIVLGISHRGQPPNDSARGAHMKRARRAHPAAILGAAVWLASGCRSADQDSPTPSASPPSSFAAEEGLHFADVTREAEIDFVHSIGDGHLSNLVESSGGGVAFLDYDQDGYLDLYMANGAFVEGVSEGPKPRRPLTNRLYRNRGNGTFEEVTDRAGVGHSGYGMGVVVADYDNDGYPDLYLSNHGPNVLYHNNGNGTFSDVTGRAGVGGSGSSVGAVWLDYDNDGLLDLYVGNYIQFDPEYDYYYAPDGFPGPLAYAGQADVLYRNRGDGTFEDVTESMGVLRPEGRAMGVSAADYDDDGYVDIYVANDAMANFLFHNEKGQRFQELALPAGVAYNHGGDATSSMAVDFADYDGDGLMDLFVSDMSYSALYRNEGNGLFRDVTYQAGIAVASGQYVGWASAFIDYDNDGDVDIFKVNGDLQHLFGQEDQLFENLEGRRFRDVSVERGSYFREALVGRGAAFGDYDNDGDIDVFIVNLNDRGVLLRNEGGNKNNWLLIRLVGRSSNRDGVGARLRVVSGDMVQVAQKKNSTGYLSQNDPRLHFGLGENEIVDRIEIVWPSGIVQVLENVRARQILTISEPQRVGS